MFKCLYAVDKEEGERYVKELEEEYMGVGTGMGTGTGKDGKNGKFIYMNIAILYNQLG